MKLHSRFRKRKNKCFYFCVCIDRNREPCPCKGCGDYIRLTNKNCHLPWTYYKDKKNWTKKEIKEDIKRLQEEKITWSTFRGVA